MFDGLDRSYWLAKALNNHFITLVSVMIIFMLYETTAAVGQQSPLNDNISRNNSTHSSLNSTNVELELDGKHIVVIWLKANETKTDIPIINISSQEFWKVFSPLLEILTNRTNDNSE